MKLLDKLKQKKQEMAAQMHRGYVRTEQMRAEKLRRRKQRVMKPGAVTAIRSGLMTRSSPLDVMKAEYSRRKYEREQKHKKKKEEG